MSALNVKRRVQGPEAGWAQVERGFTVIWHGPITSDELAWRIAMADAWFTMRREDRCPPLPRLMARPKLLLDSNPRDLAYFVARGAW